MSVNETEFVDIGRKCLNKDLNIKAENYCGDEATPGDEFSISETKCGDIFHSANGLFVFCCYYCSERFGIIEDFVSHFEEKHSKLLIAKKLLESSLNLPEVEETNKCLEAEPSETLPWATINPIKIEENLDPENCVSTDFFNGDETHAEKTSKAYSETEIQCPKCPFTFRWKNLLVDHLHRIHKDYFATEDDQRMEIKCECDICDDTFASVAELISHKSIVHSLQATEKSHEQIESNESLHSASVSLVHYQCKFCMKYFYSSSALSIHEKLHTHNNRYKYVCSYCSLSYSSRKRLLDHISQFHSNTSTRFQDATQTADHLRIAKIQANVTESPDEGLQKSKKIYTGYPCNICGRHFKHPSRLKEHELVHSTEKQHKCHYCPAEFRLQRLLSHHLRHVHKDFSLTSSKHLEKLTNMGAVNPEVSTTSISFDSEHEDVNNSSRLEGQEALVEIVKNEFLGNNEERVSVMDLEMNPEIDVRNEFEEYQQNLPTIPAATINQHKKLHTCGVCQKSFLEACRLRAHMNIHTKVKNFQCTICSAKFSRCDSLRAHEKLHSAEKQYRCTICNKAFAQYPGLYTHMKAHGVTPSRRIYRTRKSQ